MLVLTFQIGENRLGLDIRRVREVVPRVELKRSAGGPVWLAGMFIYRGMAVPVVDLHRLLGSGECPAHLSSRIILVPWPPAEDSTRTGGDERLLGLLATQVANLREVPSTSIQPSLGAHGQPGLGAALVDDEGILHLIDLDRLLPAPMLPAAFALPGGQA